MKSFLYFIVYVCLEIKCATLEFEENLALNQYLSSESNALDNELAGKGLLKGQISLEIEKKFVDDSRGLPAIFSGNFYLFQEPLDRNDTYQTIEFGRRAFVFIRGGGKIEIKELVLERNETILLQTLQASERGQAKFFVNQNNLYLMVINNELDNLSYSVLYKLVDTYFDEIEKVLMRNGNLVESFSDGNSEILIVSNGRSQNYSWVFEFKYDKLRKIQVLMTDSPLKMYSYIYKNEKYFNIIESSRDIKVYRWTGSSLSLISSFKTNYEIEHVSVLKTKQSSVILLFQLDKVMIFKPNKKGIDLESEHNFERKFEDIEIVTSQESNWTRAYIRGEIGGKVYSEVWSFGIPEEVEAEQDGVMENKLKHCFLDLEVKIYSNRRLRNSKTLKLRSDSLVADPVPEGLEERLEKLKRFVEDYELEDKLVVSGKAFFPSLTTEKVVSGDLHFEKINNQTWEPHNWLSYGKPQTVKGPVTIKSLTSSSVKVPENHSIIKGLLLNTSGQIITEPLSLDKLAANSVEVNSINGIQFRDIYRGSDPKDITGLKEFGRLNAQAARVRGINKQEAGKTLSLFTESASKDFVFDSHVTIENLWSETIDGIDWNEFRDTVFRISKDKEIRGNLTFAQFKTERLNAEIINGVGVDDLLTLSGDQVIRSSIQFGNVYAEDVDAERINERILENAATFRSGTIKGPLKVDKLYVKNDLEVVGDFKESYLRKGEHIIGTSPSDLLQIYNGSVRIKGDLYVNDIDFHPDSQVFISEEKFNLSFSDLYWTSSTSQAIPVHFEALEGLSAPHLIAKSINGVRVSNYMTDDNKPKAPTKFFFENVIIDGNLTLDQNYQHFPDLNTIEKEAVFLNGTFLINGKKAFKKLKVHKMNVHTLDGINVFNTLNKKQPAKVTAKKFFKNIIVKESFQSDIPSVNIINDINIEQLLDRAIKTTENLEIDSMNLANISVSNLQVNKINNVDINEYLLGLEKLSQDQTPKRVKVLGNVSIAHVENLHTINHQTPDEIVKSMESFSQANRVRFLGNIEIGDLEITKVNNLFLPDLMERILFKHVDQTIKAPVRMVNLKSNNLLVDKINDVPLGGLIDIDSELMQEVNISNGLRFASARFANDIEADTTEPCDLAELIQSITNPRTKRWGSITVQGNVSVLDTGSPLFKLYHKAVLKTGRYEITAPVNFTSHIKAENVETFRHINDVDLKEIIDDAVLKNQTRQSVSGRKRFSRLKALTASAEKNADILIVNDISVVELDKKLIRKNQYNNSVIKGKKVFFSGLQTEHFYSKLIRNEDPMNLVSLNNLQEVPSAVFDKIEVVNLQIDKINSVDFQNIIDNRLLLNSKDPQITNATYYFDNLTISENLMTPSINKIALSEVIFDTEPQLITGKKRFMQKVEIKDDAQISFVNGLDVSKTFEKAIMPNEDAEIDGNVMVLEPAQVNGDIITEQINGFPASELLLIANKSIEASEAVKIYDMVSQIKYMINQSIPLTEGMPSEFLYLEKSTDIQINLPNTMDAEIIDTRDHALAHITAEEEGEYCGLPTGCTCPIQHTMQISPEHSVNLFLNKGSQRIFSYDDGDMIAHLISNSVSQSSVCRTNETKVFNDVSSLVWNTKTTPLRNGSFYSLQKPIIGFISSVKFFSIPKGSTYAVIGRYYDPVLDSHRLDCKIIKFSLDKSQAEEIQAIPSQGIRAMYVYYTPLGVHLVVGNVNEQDGFENTEIYRFNTTSDQFELLTAVPGFGCTSAAGVVAGLDSLLVLGHSSGSLKVLKYDHNEQTYLPFQSLLLNSPVTGVAVFYTGGFGISQAYLSVVTEYGEYHIYSFQFVAGWKLESRGAIPGLRNLIPFRLNKQNYLFAPSRNMSTLMTIIKLGP